MKILKKNDENCEENNEIINDEDNCDEDKISNDEKESNTIVEKKNNDAEDKERKEKEIGVVEEIRSIDNDEFNFEFDVDQIRSVTEKRSHSLSPSPQMPALIEHSFSQDNKKRWKPV